MSSISRRWHASLSMETIHFVWLGALPIAILVQSPQRVVLSAAITAAYVGAAALMLRRRHMNSIVLAYIAAVALWMLASWLRTRYLLRLDATQLAYGASKTSYFVLIVLPMAAAVAAVIQRPDGVRPAAVTQVLIGAGVAALTLLLFGEKFLGADRYSWQGNLIALGTVVAVQPWPVRSFKASVVLGVIGVFGVMLASSRQAVAALVVALLLTAAYWAAARLFGKARDMRYVVLPIALVLLTAGYLATTYAGEVGVQLPWRRAACPWLRGLTWADRYGSRRPGAASWD